jgi:hypothetical protein
MAFILYSNEAELSYRWRGARLRNIENLFDKFKVVTAP